MVQFSTAVGLVMCLQRLHDRQTLPGLAVAIVVLPQHTPCIQIQMYSLAEHMVQQKLHSVDPSACTNLLFNSKKCV